jgi:hypothetical protein
MMRLCLSIKIGNAANHRSNPGGQDIATRAATRVSLLHARTGSGRGVHNQPVMSVPGFGPARPPTPTARLSQHRPQARSPGTQEPLAGSHNQCPQPSAVIIKANTNADNPTTRAVMFHLGTYIPQGVPDTFGFNGIDTSQHTGDTVALTYPSGIGLGSAVKLRRNGNGVELIGNTGG